MKSAGDLLFRRQFIMGTRESKNFVGWSHKTIGDKFHLYCHPELDITHTGMGGREIYILGYILDPYSPRYTNDQISKEIIRNCKSFDDVLAYTDKYSGRWVLLWKDGSGLKMMNDACGTRQIFFYSGENGTWLGSQPSIIAFELGLVTNMTPELREFIYSSEYKRENAWIGDGTIYDDLWHLLPNHFIDLEPLTVKRFWPVKELTGPDTDVAVKETAKIIQGTILSTLYRFKHVALSLTAGVDSRMNLAASKPVKDRIKYIFCADHPDERNTDFRISSQLLGRLKLKQDIIGLHEVNDEFTDIYNKNTTMASELPSKGFIYSFYKELPDYIHVSGVGAGIAKSFYHNDNDRAGVEKISKAAGYENSAYAQRFISKWLKDAEGIKSLRSVNIYDIFYWEHRMGNWGAKSSAEQDIAIEETWPYNNRRLLATMLSVDPKYRRPPFYKFHRMVIRHLWAETLSLPINPNFLKKLYSFVRNCLNAIDLEIR